MAATGGNTWAFVAGVLGNIISFLVFFAPVPTFYKIYKKKSTESFDSVPYIVALFSAMLWLYFALLTSDMLLMTINSAGCVIEGIYLAIFLIYANKKVRAFTLKLIFLMNVGLFGSILVLTLLFTQGKKRVSILGWAGSTFAFAVFVAPLSVIRLVIKTKSVEYMPFMLSFFLTLSAVAWFFYGLLTKDFYVALPNVLGFIFGMIQMSIFLIYKNGKKVVDSDQKPAETPLESMEVKIPISTIQEEKSGFENNPVVKEVDETKINHKLGSCEV